MPAFLVRQGVQDFVRIASIDSNPAATRYQQSVISSSRRSRMPCAERALPVRPSSDKVG